MPEWTLSLTTVHGRITSHQLFLTRIITKTSNQPRFPLSLDPLLSIPPGGQNLLKAKCHLSLAPNSPVASLCGSSRHPHSPSLTPKSTFPTLTSHVNLVPARVLAFWQRSPLGCHTAAFSSQKSQLVVPSPERPFPIVQ